MIKFFLLCVVISTLSCLPHMASGADRYWSGGDGHVWEDPRNWGNGDPPGPNDDAFVTTRGLYNYPRLFGNVSIRSLTVGCRECKNPHPGYGGDPHVSVFGTLTVTHGISIHNHGTLLVRRGHYGSMSRSSCQPPPVPCPLPTINLVNTSRHSPSKIQVTGGASLLVEEGRIYGGHSFSYGGGVINCFGQLAGPATCVIGNNTNENATVQLVGMQLTGYPTLLAGGKLELINTQMVIAGGLKLMDNATFNVSLDNKSSWSMNYDLSLGSNSHFEGSASCRFGGINFNVRSSSSSSGNDDETISGWVFSRNEYNGNTKNTTLPTGTNSTSLLNCISSDKSWSFSTSP